MMQPPVRDFAGDCQSAGQIIIENPLDKRIDLADRIYPDFILLHITAIISAIPSIFNLQFPLIQRRKKSCERKSDSQLYQFSNNSIGIRPYS